MTVLDSSCGRISPKCAFVKGAPRSLAAREGARRTVSLTGRTVGEYYNLKAIIAVGYRVNSGRATEFRRCATGVLRDFSIRGYVLDRKRLE